MPSCRIESNTKQFAPKYSVLASYTKPNSSFVRHLAILVEDGEVRFNEQTEVLEMGPPLRLGSASANRSGYELGKIRAGAMAWVDLSVSQRDGITDWLADLRTRTPARLPPTPHVRPDHASWSEFIDATHYVIYPSSLKVERRDEVSGRTVYEHYFSCVGFVLSCYHEGADLELLESSSDGSIPLAGVFTIEKVFGKFEAELVKYQQKSLKLNSTGPWGIVFPGYVLASIKNFETRTAREPHRPKFVEIKFTG